ncbi:MAG: mandelate racemase/muconate lactonizing enzyme family protein [Geminicoccaceae bacterium]
MTIKRITLWHIALTSHVAYHMGGGKSCETVETVVVRLEAESGLAGFGEVCPIPHYLPAYARGVVPAVEEMADVILGADCIGPEALMTRLDRHLPGHAYAKSAIDIALWDLLGKAAGLPLYVLLGGRQTSRLPLYHSISCLAPDVMAEMALEAKAEGIRQFQVKLGADRDWQADVARLREVRAAVGPGPLVYGDWNCGAERLDATRVGRAVADLDVMLEQPCSSLDDCAAVRAATGLPMKIDENAFDAASLLRAHDLGCMDAVALKLSKFGGLSALRRARDLCCHLGAKMCIEDCWGSDIATATALHLATATPADKVLNVCDLSGYVTPRIDPNGPSRQGGMITPPDGPGIGLDIDIDRLGEPVAVYT